MTDRIMIALARRCPWLFWVVIIAWLFGCSVYWHFLWLVGVDDD